MRTPSSNPTEVLALHPLWSVCASPACLPHLASSSLSFPSVESGSPPTHLPGPRDVRGSQAVDVLKLGPPQAYKVAGSS